MNLKFLRARACLDDFKVSSEVVERVKEVLLPILWKGQETLSEAAVSCDKRLGLDLGTSLTVNKFYGKEAATLKKAHELTLGEYFNDGHELNDRGVWVPILKDESELPTFRQFENAVSKSKDPEKDCIAREGKNAFELKGRALLRKTENSLIGPGQVGQMDATTADIYLVSKYNPNVIVGRPVVYGIKDAWGRFLYSLVAVFERPSYWGGAIALENALIDKVEYCASYGIKIGADDWPVNFLLAKLLVDGGEMSTYKTDHLVTGLGIDIDTAPPYRGDGE